MGSRFRYSSDMLEFLKKGYEAMRVPELTVAFNEAFGQDKTAQQIRATLKNNRFTCGRPTGTPKGSYRVFTEEQAEFIRQAYRTCSLAELTNLVNAKFKSEFTQQQLRSFTRNHCIRSGRNGRFEKGHVPANKGVKGWNAGGRSVETRFKKGRPAHEASNYLPIGSTRLTKDGYVERKVTDDPGLVPARRWVPEHRLMWEENHGPIPDKHVVVFLDGNKLNCDISNLRCVSRAVLQYMNKVGLNETTGEVRKAAILTSELMTRARQLERSQAESA